jgi:hypothetical protein
MPRHRKQVDSLLISYLAAGKTFLEAAELAGCSKATVQRRWADPEFRKAVEQEKQKVLRAIRTDLCKAAMLAIQTLETLLASENESIRQKAADAILTHALGRGRPDETEGPKPEKVVKILYEIVDSTGTFAPENASKPPENR